MISWCILALVLAASVSASQNPASEGAHAKLTNAQTSRASSSTSFDQLSQAADRARNESRDDDAIRLYQQALKLRPAWPEGLWYLSTVLYEKERYADAGDVLRRFLTQDTTAGPGWALLGMSEFQTREYSRSLDHLQRGMSLGLGDRAEMAQSVFYFVAVLRNRFEQYTESMDLLMAMVKSGQPTDLLIEPIGLAALRLPFLPQEIPPDRRELVRLAGQATLAVEAQRQEEAEKIFSAIVSHYPEEPGVHFLYGAYLMDLRPEDGMKEMKRELEISPFSVPARLRMAEQYINEDKPDQAQQLAQQAVALEPASSSARLILGESLIAQGKSAEGIVELEKSRDAAPGRVRTHWDLLRAYTALGRAQDAKREKEEIEKLNTPASQP